MHRHDKRKITVEIDGITEPQAIAIEDLFATWVHLGNVGSSRSTSFYADGDGNFRPKITVDGREAKTTDLISEKEKWPQGRYGGYAIDFDAISWKLRERDGE